LGSPDDILVHFAKQAEKEDYKVVMVTPDKRFWASWFLEIIVMVSPCKNGWVTGIRNWGIQKFKNVLVFERPEQVIGLFRNDGRCQ